MAVFGGSTKISRAVADPGTDRSLPSSGSLSWGGITGASGVAGTTGADAKLVNGDRWQQISGNHTENVTADVKTTVMGNQTHTIQGNQTIGVSGNVTRDITGNLTTSIIGAEMRSNIGVQNHTYVAPTSRVHSGFEGTEEQGGFFRSIHAQWEWHSFVGETNAIKMEQNGSETTFIGLKTEVVAVETQVGSFSNGLRGFHFETDGVKNFVGAMSNKLDGTSTVMHMVDAEMGFRMKVPPESIPGVE